MRFFPLALVIGLLLNTANSQDYLWPTNSSRLLSSTFGEYRTDHLHAGIDIKTNYRTGYPVYAIESGYIQKLRTSYTGYGKVIYQKLDDGNIAVYAHLENFAEPLLKLIRLEQERQRRYRVEVNLDKNLLRVVKGQIIGYTGDTGTLYPHLHFELRDSLENPINPLNTNLSVADNTAPTIEGLAVTPISLSARVNGMPTTRTFKATHQKNNRYTINESIHVEGQFGIEVRTRDTVKGVPNVYPPYGIKLFIDDSLCFQVQYDKFSYEQTRYAGIDRNYQLDYELGEIYNRLWVFAPQKTLPMNILPEATGIFDLETGEHRVRIFVYDKNQNSATLEFNIIATRSAPLLLSEIQSLENGYQVFVTPPEHMTLQNIKADWVSRQGDFQRPAQVGQIDSTAEGYRITLTDQPSYNEHLKIEAAGAKGEKLQPLFGRVISQNNSATITLEYKFIHNPKTFLMKVIFSDVPNGYPTFYLQTNDGLNKVELIRTSPVEFITAPVSFARWRDAFAFEMRFNTHPMNVSRGRLNLKCMAPNTENRCISQDSLFTAFFPVDAVYDSLIVWLNSLKAKPVNGGRIVSHLYTLYPTNQPLHDTVRISFKHPTFVTDIGQIGIYIYEKNKWRWLGNRIDTENNLIHTTSRQLGKFALIKDNTAPTIRNIFPGNGGRFRASSVKTLRAIVQDELSGIDSDLDIIITLDGNPLIAEYNAPKNSLKHELAGRLADGQHTLVITVTDRAGNVKTHTSTFIILPG